MNLIISNLLTIFVLVFLLISESLDASGLGFTRKIGFCAVTEGLTAFIMTSSICSVLLIGIDQYLAVVDPLRYRTRIDKLKCALLIIAVWFVALLFGVLASFNPQPRGLWRLCCPRPIDDADSTTSQTSRLHFQASLLLSPNITQNLEIEGEILSFQGNVVDDDDDDANPIKDTLNDYDTNTSSSSIHQDLIKNDGEVIIMTYGFVYACVYALFGYLVPYLAICWIYIRIYAAARNNSERTRRNGSRPFLSSASSCEEACAIGHCKLDFETGRLNKISSLSSIDENSELSPSQVASNLSEERIATIVKQEGLPDQIQKDHSNAAAGRRSSVIFTVGSTKFDKTTSPVRDFVAAAADDDDEEEVVDDDAKDNIIAKPKVPTAELKAKFLKNPNEAEDTIRSRFTEVPVERRKSSHDLMYDEMMMMNDYQKHPYEYEDGDDEDDGDSSDDHEYPADEASPLSTETIYNTDHHQTDHDNDLHRSQPVSTRSNSVNFDLGDQRNQENSRMLENDKGDEIDGIIGNSVQNPPSTPPMVTITSPGQKTVMAAIPIHRVSSVKSTHSYISHLKYRISNASLFKYREETRAARISALVIVMGLICWTPYVYVLLARNIPPIESGASLPLNNNDSSGRSLNLDRTALGFLVLATYLSPLLFGYRSKRIKRELRKFFCFKRELSYKNNRSLMAKKVLKRRHSGQQINTTTTDAGLDHSRYNIFNCVYGRSRWPKDKVQFVQVPDAALAVETCRSSFSSGASTQISSTSTDEC